MQEIYLPAFKAAVLAGKAGAVMNSYNLLNGVHATQNAHLNNEILKGQWGFSGILMSDWGSTHDGLAAAKGGLDLEMPQADFMNSSTLLPYISNGTLPESVIDDKVRRILRIIFSFGFYDKNQTDISIPLNNPTHVALAQKIAENGIVLLKNQDSILPLSLDTIKSIALIGPNANQYITGGGSSYTSPYKYTTIYQGLKNILDTSVIINLTDGILNTSKLAARSVFFTDSTLTTKGLTGFYFKNQNLTNPPDY
jgi:Beta-glucosidase-related glycosidases